MDPFIASSGRRDHALLLDCRSNEPIWLPLSDPAIVVLIINTNVRHHLAISAYAVRREECRTAASALGIRSLRDASSESLAHHFDGGGQAVVRRAWHVITEIARTLQAAVCIRDRDWSEFGQLMDASHASLRDDYEVSCKELGAVVEIASDIGRRGGIFGCRMTGGGFGGCAVALIEADRREEIVRVIDAGYRSQTQRAPTFLTSRAGFGAELVEV
jgi:galactokinase